MFLFLIFLGEGSACPFKYMSIVGRSFTEVKSLNIEDHFHSRLPGRKERTRNHGLVVLRRSCMDLKNTVLTGSSTLHTAFTPLLLAGFVFLSKCVSINTGI